MTKELVRASSRFPCFDGLRAFAAITVIGVHITFASGFSGRHPFLRPYVSRLEIGVEVFFVISGFLLYRPFAAAHFGVGRMPAIRQFWVRRLKRIIPGYWVAFIVISYLMKDDLVYHAWYSPLVYLGFAQIYLPHYVLTGLTQAWSLCTEMSFYVGLPLYAAAVGGSLRRRRAEPGGFEPDQVRDTGSQLRAELIGLAVLVAVSFAYRVPVLLAGGDRRGTLTSTMVNWLPGYLDVFAFGMLLAVLSVWISVEDRRPSWLWHPSLPWISWGLAFLAFVAVSNLGLPWKPVTPSPVLPSLARQTLYGLFGFFMVAPAVFGEQNRGLIRRGLQLRPIAAVGVVSYGVYLWHESWMDMFFKWTGDRLFTIPLQEMFVVVTGLAIVSATLSWLIVEKPIVRGQLPVMSLRLGRSRLARLRLRRSEPAQLERTAQVVSSL